MKKPDYKRFTAEIMQAWPWGDVDVFDLQEIAVKYGMLSEIEGGFDPSKHSDPTETAEEGDSFFERTYDMEVLRTPVENTPVNNLEPDA
jgi:hypothetical protein